MDSHNSNRVLLAVGLLVMMVLLSTASVSAARELFDGTVDLKCPAVIIACDCDRTCCATPPPQCFITVECTGCR